MNCKTRMTKAQGKKSLKNWLEQDLVGSCCLCREIGFYSGCDPEQPLIIVSLEDCAHLDLGKLTLAAV